MKFDDDRVDASQLQDQRGGRGGMSRGTAVGAGVGGVGILGSAGTPVRRRPSPGHRDPGSTRRLIEFRCRGAV